MDANECVFCKIARGEIPSNKVFEDEKVLAFLDIGPVSTGHTLVIPKQHYEKLHEVPAGILSSITVCVGRVAKAVSQAVRSDGYNVLCNNGKAAGQLVDHVHFHIIPRNDGDGVFNRWPAGSYEEGQAEEIRKRICDSL